jgi:adenosylcobinamide-GDP ribazoletransferase
MLNHPIFDRGRAEAAGRRLVVAMQFLTSIPMPQLADVRFADLSRSSVFFPAVGAAIGLCVTGAMLVGDLINPIVAGLAGVVMWVLITGALHLDGLGDVADAFGASHHNPERFREVLHDPHAGSFAVVAIVLQIAAKIVLLASVAMSANVWAVVLIPAWARWGALVWARVLRPLWPGTGEQFAAQIGWRSIAVWEIALVLASAWIAPKLLAAIVIVPLVIVFWRWRLGGMTGDCLGASIEVTETLLLVALLMHLG